MKFVYPWMLILVALVPVIGAFWVFLRMRAEKRLTGLVAQHLQSRLLPHNPQLFKLQALLLLTGMFLAFFAAARPQWGHSAQVVQTKSRNVVVALDVSRSMLAADIRPNRLERAKADIADLIDSLEGDRCALVAFRRTGVLLCPLTTDHAFLRSALEGASPESAPRGETDLGSAIRTALDALDPAADDHNAIILISDGGDLRGGALDAAKIADKRNVPIFTVGLGNPKAETAIPDASGAGMQQYQGKTVTTKLEDATLSAIAKASGGRYVPLATAGTAETTLGAIYRRFLRQVAMKEQAEEEELRATERFVIFLVPGLVLILLAAFFSRGRFAGRNMRKAAVAALAMVMTSTTLFAQEQEEPTDVWNRAYDAYAAGNVTNALSILQSRKFPPKYEARAAELIGKILFERMQKDYAENPLAAITNAEEAAVQMQIALRTNPGDARMNRNFTRAVDPLKQLRETAHVAEVLKASQNQGPDQLLGAAVREARELMKEQRGVLTNEAATAVAKSEALGASAKKLSDTWIPVKQTVIQSVTNQQQAAMIVGDVEAARDATKKAAEQLADMNPGAGQTLADVESAVTRFWKAVVMPIEAITEDIKCQTNAFAAVEKFNGRDWQKEALEFTQAFREKFPQWAPQYEQHINQKLQEAAKANTNAPPPKPVFTKETQAEIMRLAEDAQKKQEEMVKQELPPVQQEIIEILKKIDELIPREPSGGSSQQQQNQQNQQQNQNDQQKNDDKNDEQQNQNQQQQQDEQKDQQQQEKKEEKSQAEQPKDMKDVEDLLRKAQERSDEHEADKKARARKIPSAPNERDW